MGCGMRPSPHSHKPGEGLWGLSHSGEAMGQHPRWEQLGEHLLRWVVWGFGSWIWGGKGGKMIPSPSAAPELTFPNASSLPSPTAPGTCPGSAPLAPSGSRTLKKKIGNFFAFKKPKSSRGSRCEKEPEGGGPAAPRSRRSMLSDILRAPSKAGEASKPLSKSEEGGLGAEPEHCRTPDSARRIRPKYSREGKSQSLILLPGEDEDALGVRQDKVSAVTEPPPLMGAAATQGCCWGGGGGGCHPGTAGGCRDSGAMAGDVPPLGCGHALVSPGCCAPHPGRAVSVPQKRHLEKSEGELPGSFEQRVQVMLHRIGVTKGPAAEGKKQQVGKGSSFGMDPAPKERVEVVVCGMGVAPALPCHCLWPRSCHLTLCKRTNMWAPMSCTVSVCLSLLPWHAPVPCSHPRAWQHPALCHPSSQRVLPP